MLNKTWKVLGAVLAVSAAPAFANSHAPELEKGAPSAATLFSVPGNLCEPELAKFCLGVQGFSRQEALECLREHQALLSADCARTVGPSNRKKETASATSHPRTPRARWGHP